MFLPPLNESCVQRPRSLVAKVLSHRADAQDQEGRAQKGEHPPTPLRRRRRAYRLSLVTEYRWSRVEGAVSFARRNGTRVRLPPAVFAWQGSQSEAGGTLLIASHSSRALGRFP